MLAILAGLLAVATQTNCLQCLDKTDQNTTYAYCWDDKLCYPEAELVSCTETATSRTTRCVEELGGDAVKSVRYAIGFSILGIAIAIDITVRVLVYRRANDEYSHL